jgi:hypothetical protein
MLTPEDGPGQLLPDEQGRALAAATKLLAKHGPSTVSLKWVAMSAEVPPDRVTQACPTVEVLLDAVLDRLSVQFEELTGGVLGLGLSADEAAGRCCIEPGRSI